MSFNAVSTMTTFGHTTTPTDHAAELTGSKTLVNATSSFVFGLSPFFVYNKLAGCIQDLFYCWFIFDASTRLKFEKPKDSANTETLIV